MAQFDSRAATPLFENLPGDVEPIEGPLPGITLSGDFRFRAGQDTFLRKLAAAFQDGHHHHLGVFVPGYGKTITALSSFVVAKALGVAEKLVVFVPRGNLRDQYADAQELAQVFQWLSAPPFSFCVADSERVFLKNLGTDIVITTYQYASGEGGRRALEKFCAKAPSLFVFDEVHHLATDGTWAQQIDTLDFAASIALSGTPLRSDGKLLFGVPFEEGPDDEQFYRALHEVGLRDAHEEGGILKRVEAHVVDYSIKMVRGDTGEEVDVTLSQMAEIAKKSKDLDAYLTRRKLRFHDVYLDALLRPAFERFAEKREQLKELMIQKAVFPFRQHQMLVIAMSNRHAAAMLAFIKQHFPQFKSTRIGQDIAARTRAERLDAYREGEIDVMVQVDMIGEGTDIKPISIIVKADLVRAQSKTMQQVFRGMRYYNPFGEEANRCDLYASNDSEVVDTLRWLASEEQQGVKIRQEKAAQEEPTTPPTKSPGAQSPWELKEVRQSQMASHQLDKMPGYNRRVVPNRGEQVVDVRAREQNLRQSCASLANEVAFALQTTGRDADVRDVHKAAKQRFGKTQDELSLGELVRKKQWLERCLRARRLL